MRGEERPWGHWDGAPRASGAPAAGGEVLAARYAAPGGGAAPPAGHVSAARRPRFRHRPAAEPAAHRRPWDPPAPRASTSAAEEEAPAPGPGDRSYRDWAGGLPADVLVAIATKLATEREEAYEAALEDLEYSKRGIREAMQIRAEDGHCLFPFAMVCKQWHRAQVRVGRRMCTRVEQDIVVPGRVELVKWALAEGCPREGAGQAFNMVACAAKHGHLELVRWLVRERGFALDVQLMNGATFSGNLELVRWLRRERCPWNGAVLYEAARAANLELLQWLCGEQGCEMDETVMQWAVRSGNLKVVQWLRGEGCPWDSTDRHTWIAVWASNRLEEAAVA